MTDYFVTVCRNCSETIEMREINDNKWLPYEYNGVRHNCLGRRRQGK